MPSLFPFLPLLFTLSHAQTVSLPEPLPLPPAKPDCFSLKDSHFCGASFGEYLISSKTIVNGIPTTDVTAFDRAMSFYFGSPSDVKDINDRFGCQGGSGWDGTYEPPYRSSFTCRGILMDESTSICNQANPIPPLCKGTCQQYTRGWETVIRNETACPAPVEEEDRKMANLLAWCDVTPFNGTVGQCIDGSEEQERTCGFLLPLQLPYLCSFCKFSADPCCRSSNAMVCPAESSPRDLTILVCSIVFGCLGGIGLIAGIALFLKRRRIDRAQRELPKPDAAKPSTSTLRVNSAVSSVNECVCEFPYSPTMADELCIEPGDSILVLWMFDDGWAVGRNVTRGGEGAFPLACVVHKLPDSAHGSTSSMVGSAYPRRTSSKRASNQARPVS
ncbi:hypothetical protein K493DRAFT_311698 [Basidiobolus meristosporus CBS 931.73]|uniref:SH3 domain-containing protein n=1 Tax=Basidiobolus meristosporus CBS 931.73 TaxID=1314790 RepID=A0A1Y1YZI0_9FUNG|nr:hypothetical protein K493DRAFT_311698 [Basidiobolus meristosporus CBS 931.73]|eukprot:ORY03431.1 hypothetical protein K493DRAFT_311698 [Basidiobolus meristosporus CBS 931.73]